MLPGELLTFLQVQDRWTSNVRVDVGSSERRADGELTACRFAPQAPLALEAALLVCNAPAGATRLAEVSLDVFRFMQVSST